MTRGKEHPSRCLLSFSHRSFSSEKCFLKVRKRCTTRRTRTKEKLKVYYNIIGLQWTSGFVLFCACASHCALLSHVQITVFFSSSWWSTWVLWMLVAPTQLGLIANSYACLVPTLFDHDGSACLFSFFFWWRIIHYFWNFWWFSFKIAKWTPFEGCINSHEKNYNMGLHVFYLQSYFPSPVTDQPILLWQFQVQITNQDHTIHSSHSHQCR